METVVCSQLIHTKYKMCVRQTLYGWMLIHGKKQSRKACCQTCWMSKQSFMYTIIFILHKHRKNSKWGADEWTSEKIGQKSIRQNLAKRLKYDWLSYHERKTFSPCSLRSKIIVGACCSLLFLMRNNFFFVGKLFEISLCRWEKGSEKWIFNVTNFHVHTIFAWLFQNFQNIIMHV